MKKRKFRITAWRMLILILFVCSADPLFFLLAIEYENQDQLYQRNLSYSYTENSIELVHPLFTEIAAPHEALRLDYFFSQIDDNDGEISQGVKLIVAYAWNKHFGIELELPNSWHMSQNHQGYFEQAHLSLKGAQEISRTLSFGYGFAFFAPFTEHEENGHEDIFHLENYYAMGWAGKNFQAGLNFAISLPLEEEHSNDYVNYGIYTVLPLFQGFYAVLEFGGESHVNGDTKGETIVNFATGMRIYPLLNSEFSIGMGMKVPFVANMGEWEGIVSVNGHY